MVRFRLKKSLPFDVDQSSVSFERQGSGNQIRVVAAVTPRHVLDEYESLVREAGYNPGTVLPSHAGGARAGGCLAAYDGDQG